MPKKAIESGADMEEEVDNAGYLIIISALKARKAKLKQAECQLRDQISELQQEILEVQESNQSHCSCSYDGGEDTPTRTRTATHDATNMPRYGFDVLSTAGTSQPVPPITTLERYNETRAKLVSSLKKLYIDFVIQQEECEADVYEQSSDQKFIVAN